MASSALVLLLHVGHCQALLLPEKSLMSYNCFNCQALPEGGDQAGVAEQVSTWGGEHLLPGGQAPQRIKADRALKGFQ